MPSAEGRSRSIGGSFFSRPLETDAFITSREPHAWFSFSDSDATDDNGHGTHVAGIVTSSDSYYKGVAPGASLMIAKVLGSDGSGSSSDVIAGIDWCVSNGAEN